MLEEFRTEEDSLGSLKIPQKALYGIATERALRHSNIGGYKVPWVFIRAMAILKYACASANEALGLLPKTKSVQIQRVAWEIFEGKLKEDFPLEIFQTGGCTPTNMNLNEVIANRVAQWEGLPLGGKTPLHPNDDCNLGQSTNDLIPTALNIASYWLVKDLLLPALENCRFVLLEKEKAWSEIVKVGRTHLMDAVLMTLGQEFSAYRRQVEKTMEKITSALPVLWEVPIGGTAVGNGLNSHPHFGQRVVETLNNVLGTQFCPANNCFEKQASRDDYVFFAGLLDTAATTFSKLANDIRWLGSGPTCGLNELHLPATQAGSSCMPGKINPVVCETLLQACIFVQGNCDMIRRCATLGAQFQLNTTTMLLVHALLESFQCFSKAIQLFTESVLRGLQPNLKQLRHNVENSYALVTALMPLLGYDRATLVAQKAYESHQPLLELTKELCEDVPEKDLKLLLYPLKLASGHLESRSGFP